MEKGGGEGLQLPLGSLPEKHETHDTQALCRDTDENLGRRGWRWEGKGRGDGGLYFEHNI